MVLDNFEKGDAYKEAEIREAADKHEIIMYGPDNIIGANFIAINTEFGFCVSFVYDGTSMGEKMYRCIYSDFQEHKEWNDENL